MSSNRVVVITGASAGVGRATTRAFARTGAALALLARGNDGLEAARAEAEELGAARVIVVSTDVADADQVFAAARRTEEELGPIDVWINNAMVSVFAPARQLEPQDVKRVTEVTYLGYVYGTLAALDRMLPRDSGTIVQVGSALAYRAIPLQAAYCGAKHAIEGFTESVRCELMHDRTKVKITMVQLPAMNTPQFDFVKTTFTKHPQPVPPIYQPEIAADAIAWAAEHPRREILVGTPTVRAVLANKVIPGLLDRYLARNGYDSQQAERPIEDDRPHNLWEPIPGDHGAHGEFEEQAEERSWQTWLNTTGRRGAAGAGGAAVAAALWLKMRRS